MKCSMAIFLAMEQSSLYSLVFLITLISSNLSSSLGTHACGILHTHSFALRLSRSAMFLPTGQSAPCRVPESLWYPPIRTGLFMTSVLRHPHAPQPLNQHRCPPYSCLELSPSVLSDKNRQDMTFISEAFTRASEPSSPLWKSTYPCPASYCLKLSMVFSPIIDVSVLA